jgi:tripartite-type tricarboxylate transporter receptor subunit TctC
MSVVRSRWAVAMILLAGGAAAYYVHVRSAPDSSNWLRGTVRLVTPMAAGGGPDVVGRILAEALAERWKHPVIVDNRPGADGVIAARALIDARDGHTLLFSPSSVVAVNPLMHESLPYDPIADVVPIAPVVDAVVGIVCAPSFNAASVGELVTLARNRPSRSVRRS